MKAGTPTWLLGTVPRNSWVLLWVSRIASEDRAPYRSLLPDRDLWNFKTERVDPVLNDEPLIRVLTQGQKPV